MTEQFKAFGINKYGTVDNIELVSVPKPTNLGERDLLVKVKAFAVNPVDYKMRNNLTNSPDLPYKPFILGWDAAGVVEATGSKTSLFKQGDEVYFAGVFTRQGSYAEYVVVDERIVGRRPKNLNWAESAAVPLTAITAYEGLFEELNVGEDKTKNASKTILIINGAGGVGSIAIQLAKKVAGLTVIATASREETINFVKKMGADYVINHRNDLHEQLKGINVAENGVDYVFCCHDTDLYFNKIPSLTKPLGKVVFINPLEKESKINPEYFFKRIPIFWEIMFARPMYGVEPEKQYELLNRVAKLFEEGQLITTLTKSYKATLDDVKAAQSLVESGKAIGKVALEW